METQKAPLHILILYALGQLGSSLAIFGAGNLLNFFYLPPEGTTGPGFPNFIYTSSIMGLTLLGIVAFSGRIFDGITDPLIASWSDRSESKMGRRTKYMAISLIPTALFSFLLFYPISGDLAVNSIWLAAVMFLFFFFLTMYVTPYTAMISELGHTPNERLTISTLISVTFALGFGIGNSVYAVYPMIQESFGLGVTQAFQATIGLFSVFATICMALPVLFVNEKKYCISQSSKEDIITALKSVFANRNFRFFAFSDLMYWLSLTFIQMGIAYYVSVLLELDTGLSSLVMIGILGGSFLFYLPVNILARKYGKKKLVIAAFIGLMMTFGTTTLLDASLSIDPMIQLALIAAFTVIPITIFSILPNAIVADIADEDGQRTGEYKAGMFFAARNFMMKMGISIANLIFPSLLLLGKSVEDDTGVRATAVLALIFCAIGTWLFTRYRE